MAMGRMARRVAWRDFISWCWLPAAFYAVVERGGGCLRRLGLTATLVSASQVNLAWQDVNGNETQEVRSRNVRPDLHRRRERVRALGHRTEPGDYVRLSRAGVQCGRLLGLLQRGVRHDLRGSLRPHVNEIRPRIRALE
jgi:hypothetical protein